MDREVREQIKKEFEEIGIKIEFGSVYIFTNVQEVNNFQFKEIASILEKHGLKYVESGVSDDKTIWIQHEVENIQDTLNEIKKKLDKDFMTYSEVDSEISLFVYNVYYTLYVTSTTQEFWSRLEKHSLEIFEMRIVDGKIRLYMRAGDIRWCNNVCKEYRLKDWLLYNLLLPLPPLRIAF